VSAPNNRDRSAMPPTSHGGQAVAVAQPGRPNVPRVPSVPAPCGSNVAVQRKPATTPRAPAMPAVPAPCGGRTAAPSVQRKVAAPAVPAPCGGRTAAPSVQRKAAAPAVPAPCGGRTAAPSVQRKMAYPGAPPAPAQRSAQGGTVQRLVVWGDADHKARATALGGAVGENVADLHDAKLNLGDCKDATLTIWGHGNAEKLGGYTSGELAARLAELKVSASSIRTIELITCDASNPEYASGASYAKKLSTALAGANMNLTIKGLPGGAGADKSILYYYSADSTFVYITFKNTAVMENYHDFQRNHTKAQCLAVLAVDAKDEKITYRTGGLADFRGILVNMGGSAQEWSCLVSTACVRAMGLPDDCAELEALRGFRDGYVLSRPGGAEEVQAYYRDAPAVVAAIQALPDADDRLGAVYRSMVLPCVELIRAERYDEAFDLYKTEIRRLQAELGCAPGDLPG
jgi:hypothetical protein